MTSTGPAKASPTAEIWISEKSLFIFIVSMTVLGSVILIPTAYIRWRHKRLMEPEVFPIILAYALYLANELVLLNIQPRVYRLSYVTLGIKPVYPEVIHDRHDVIVLAYVSTYLFYSSLWCIKISLILFFRPFLRALPDQVWWLNITIAYLIVTFAFGFLTTLLSCGGPQQLNHVGQFMMLPLRLLYKMHISHSQKIRAGALFSVGVLCMITAIIRLVQIGSKTGITNPNVQWLSLWGAVEATTAIIVGCLPTFRLLFKSPPGEGQPNYSLKMPCANSASSSNPSTQGHREQRVISFINLKSFSSRSDSQHLSRGETTASLEELAPTGRAGTLVTPTGEDRSVTPMPC
ncbi:conserved hypothetical protein [Microsporum canis CBS 113480]|uniref:Rhodopsin domain-containing protein n=1 Tax=Arthroderma otae (strain ATCC MYA-4605 / CBS 113480) TaxID=554155 RepID=C5FXG2_ARTOC|nr:conserved hypothetical protein [Microsporum canis CBS 113480]EEQ35002.1 conserved hypothetical protein [Microsporum canis CBS 113480]